MHAPGPGPLVNEGHAKWPRPSNYTQVGAHGAYGCAIFVKQKATTSSERRSCAHGRNSIQWAVAKWVSTRLINGVPLGEDESHWKPRA